MYVQFILKSFDCFPIIIIMDSKVTYMRNNCIWALNLVVKCSKMSTWIHNSSRYVCTRNLTCSVSADCALQPRGGWLTLATCSSWTSTTSTPPSCSSKWPCSWTWPEVASPASSTPPASTLSVGARGHLVSFLTLSPDPLSEVYEMFWGGVWENTLITTCLHSHEHCHQTHFGRPIKIFQKWGQGYIHPQAPRHYHQAHVWMSVTCNEMFQKWGLAVYSFNHLSAGTWVSGVHLERDGLYTFRYCAGWLGQYVAATLLH